MPAAKMGLEGGAHAFFTPDQVATNRSHAGLSTHEADLLKVLEFARALGTPLPPITVFGVEPVELADEPGLSPVLEARFEEYVATAVGFFRR